MLKSREVRKLAGKWERGDFPKHLEWVEPSFLALPLASAIHVFVWSNMITMM